MLFGVEPQNSFGTPVRQRGCVKTHVAERNDPKSPLATEPLAVANGC